MEAVFADVGVSLLAVLNSITNTIPQGVVAVVIIIAGIYLIKGKNDELNKENHDIPSPPYLENKEK